MIESRLDGSFQRSQVTLNHEPDAQAINPVVFMPQTVSDAAYLRPRNLRTEFLRLWPEFARRFADSFQTALDGVVRLGSATKALTSMPAVNSSIRIMFSRMSLKR